MNTLCWYDLDMIPYPVLCVIAVRGHDSLCFVKSVLLFGHFIVSGVWFSNNPPPPFLLRQSSLLLVVVVQCVIF